MIKIVNISKRNITIGVNLLLPLDTITITTPEDKIMNKLTSLSNLGLIKIFPEVVENNTPSKKRKSK